LIEHSETNADNYLAPVEIVIVCTSVKGFLKSEDTWIYGGSGAPPKRQSLSTV